MAWLFSWFALLLAIPAVQVTTCTMGNENSWFTSLLFFTPGSIFVLIVIWFFRRHHAKWVFLSIPLIIILPYCIFFAGKFFLGTTLQNHPLCHVLTGDSGFNEYASSWWARFWAPLQLVILGAYVWVVFNSWRRWFHERRGS